MHVYDCVVECARLCFTRIIGVVIKFLHHQYSDCCVSESRVTLDVTWQDTQYFTCIMQTPYVSKIQAAADQLQ